MSDALMTAYKPLPIHFVRGEGIYLYDEDNNAYLDALCGIAVTGLGHTQPAVTEAICDQAQRVIHTSNVYQIPQQAALAKRLTQLTGLEQAFFCNSGAEANEAAIKLARLYGHQQGIETPTIVVAEGAFHGRTLATLTASGSRKVQAGYEPLISGFIRTPYNDMDALHTIAKNRQDIAALLIEPVQGESGIRVPAPDYLTQLRALCDEHQWLLIIDEVQTGVGRTGALYAYQHENILPDILTTAKGLGNGIPIGACLMRGNATDLFQPGKHGSTFGGNPLACRAALAVLDVIEQDNLLENATKMGDYLLAQLKDALANHESVVEIRNKGLMFGIEMKTPCRDIMTLGLKHRLLFNVTQDTVIRLLPPLIITQSDADQIVERLTHCIQDFF